MNRRRRKSTSRAANAREVVMKKLHEARRFKTDVLKLVCLALALMTPALVLYFAPGLTTSVLISVAVTLILSPGVKALERRGLSRGSSILVVFSVITLLLGAGSVWLTRSMSSEWGTLQEK